VWAKVIRKKITLARVTNNAAAFDIGTEIGKFI
jgi:hypothetical protein